MDCTACRDAILEAEPADLRSLTDSALSRHLQRCPACRGLVTQMLEAEDKLRGYLGQAPQPQTVAAAIESASARADVIRRRRRRAWATAVPAVAAAGVAVALLVRTGGPAPPNGGSPIGPTIGVPLVETTPAQHVAVLGTDNPNIVVVWTF